MSGLTLYDKIWGRHVVKTYDDGDDLLYIDRHIVHEVSSPQAFAGLIAEHRRGRRPGAHIGVADHAGPTRLRSAIAPDRLAGRQISHLEANTERFSIPYIPIDDRRHGIVHVIGPETGFTLPGCTLACGDSHTCTHGAFGAVAFGIGSSECECIFATQTLRQRKQKRMRVNLMGRLPHQVTVKDVILAVINQIGVSGGVGYAIEYAGSAIADFSMEARMTLCNMSIEAGSRVGMIAPDRMTFAYLKGRPLAPDEGQWDAALADWMSLRTDENAVFDRELALDVTKLSPRVSWGTTPEENLPITAAIPDPAKESDPARRERMRRSLDYMDLHPRPPLDTIAVNRGFIGSCTNGRSEDLRAAAAVVEGRLVASTVTAIVVPGSASVRIEAEAEGLDQIFRAAGFEWRESGCSMCVAMNADRLSPGERCASTSNRNFEGRQGQGGRTHLMSPAMAAAAAVAGHLIDVRAL